MLCRKFEAVLALAAFYESKLNPLLPDKIQLTKATLTALLESTVRRFSEVVWHSPILAMELRILNNALQHLASAEGA